VLDNILGLVCILWLILTIVCQFDGKFSRLISSFDKFGLIPRWTFFAPNPCDFDIHLLVRFAKGTVISKWQETELTKKIYARNKWTRGIFNPYRRIEKLLFDFANEARASKDKQVQIRHLSGYIFLLRFSEFLAIEQDAEKVQFMLAGSNTILLPNSEIIMVSDLHSLVAS
jgi:hypothetical protein